MEGTNSSCSARARAGISIGTKSPRAPESQLVAVLPSRSRNILDFARARPANNENAAAVALQQLLNVHLRKDLCQLSRSGMCVCGPLSGWRRPGRLGVRGDVLAQIHRGEIGRAGSATW